MKKRIFLILSPIRETYPENYEGMIVFLGNKDHQYIKEKNPPTGKYRESRPRTLSFNVACLIFSIIITNRNTIATAPT